MEKGTSVTGEAMLELQGISKSFPGVRALNEVHLSLRPGTVHALVGENGAGKSTLMKILDGVYQPDEGQILLNGKKAVISSPIEARKHGIAMIFQELTYVPDLTIAENLCLGDWPVGRFGVDWKSLRRNADDLLRREGLPYSPDTLMRSLSVSDIQMMVGRKLENQFPKENIPVGNEVLRVEKLRVEGVFEDIDFHLRAGEIVGFFGLMGAGRTEIMRAIFGLDRYDGGHIYIEGKKSANRTVAESVRAGVAMLTEDRRRSGIIPMRSVKENTTISSLARYYKSGRYFKKRELREVGEACASMNVKTPSLDTHIATLSGGNQQKVLLARWLLCEPRVLILDEPTRGIDVGAKKEIYQLMTAFAKKGNGIIMVSSEMPELIGMCDRIYVLHEGRLTGELARDGFSQQAIMNLAIQ